MALWQRVELPDEFWSQYNTSRALEGHSVSSLTPNNFDRQRQVLFNDGPKKIIERRPQPSGNLSMTGHEWLALATHSNWNSLNQDLHDSSETGQPIEKLDPWHRRNIKVMDGLIARTVTRHPIRVHRGDSRWSQLQVGDTTTSPAFLCTTHRLDTAENFDLGASIRHQKDNETPTVATIHLPTGSHLTPVYPDDFITEKQAPKTPNGTSLGRVHMGDQETLLPRNLSLTVTHRHVDENGKVRLVMKPTETSKWARRYASNL